MEIADFQLSNRNHAQLIEVTLPDYYNPGSEEIGFKLEVRSMEARNFSPVEGLEAVDCTEDEEEFLVQHPGFTIHLDLMGNTGEVELAATPAWGNVLRCLYFHGFLPRGGLLLHASGVVRGGEAYVFPGPSGSGKTTIVNHSSEGRILSDEVILVRLPTDDGGPLIASGTPFFGDWGRPGEKIAAPVKGFYFPSHALENRLIPLSPREVLKRLLPCVFTYTNWQPRLQKVFGLAAQLAGSVPGYDLHFQPSPDFWQVIDAS